MQTRSTMLVKSVMTIVTNSEVARGKTHNQTSNFFLLKIYCDLILFPIKMVAIMEFSGKDDILANKQIPPENLAKSSEKFI